MKTFLPLFLTLFLSFEVASNEELFIVSDIDDTIKITHVGSAEMFVKGLQSHNHFLGINELYMRWSCFGLKNNRSSCMKERAKVMAGQRRMSYVSGAPKPIHKLAKNFLKKNNFPSVPFYGRPSLRVHTLDFKIEIIEKIIKKNPRSKFIFVGDNGEKDPTVYNTLSKKYPKKIEASYLHALYDIKGKKTSLYPEQIPYLTSVDLGIHFYNKGWVTSEDLKKVTQMVIKTYKKKPKNLIPKWFHCKKYFSYGLWPSLKGTAVSQNNELNQLISKAKGIIKGLKSCR